MFFYWRPLFYLQPVYFFPIAPKEPQKEILKKEPEEPKKSLKEKPEEPEEKLKEELEEPKEPKRPLKREVSWIDELQKESVEKEAKEKKMRMEWWNMRSSQKVQSEKWETLKIEEEGKNFLAEMHKQVREKGGRNVRIEIGDNLEKDGETNQDYIFIRLVVHNEH